MKAKFIWPALIGLYLITRLVNLKAIPIFTDEAIYTYWAQVALHDPVNRFISLEDGKQPLFIWLAAIFQQFIADPLIATRLVSVAAGLGSLVGIYLLTRNHEKPETWTPFLASLLYILSPFTLLYDRMALFDSLLTMLGIWTVFFSVKLAREVKLDTAVFAGMAVGGAMITKSSGVLFLYLLPAALLFFNTKSKNPIPRLAKWAALAVLTFVLSQVIYNLLRLSPLFYIIGRKNLEFIRTTQEVLANPFLSFQSNLASLTEWIITYLSLPLFIVFVAGALWGIFKRQKPVIYLLVLILVPFAIELVFNKVLYPRFVLFYFPYIIIITAFALVGLWRILRIRHRYLPLVLAALLILPALNSFKLLTNPTWAHIAQSDAGQYLNDWPAGYGVAEIVQFLKNQPQGSDIYVGTEGTFGLLPYALQVYFYAEPKIHIIGFWPVQAHNLPAQIVEVAKSNKTYFVFNESQLEIANPHLKLIARYQKGIGKSYMRLYEVTP